MKRTRPDYIGNDCEEWIKKCVKCKHCYVKKKNLDEVYCSCKKGCNFKPLQEKQNESNNRS